MSRDNGTDLLTRTTPKLARPKQFSVVILNDDYTPVDFVIPLLREVFKLTTDQASARTMEIHKKGRAQFGPYTFSEADGKVTKIMDRARAKGHPLMAKYEPA